MESARRDDVRVTGATDAVEAILVADVPEALGGGFTIYADRTLRQAANVFARNDVSRAIVLDRADGGRIVGEITLDQLLHVTRSDLHEEERRERFIGSSRLRSPVAF